VRAVRPRPTRLRPPHSGRWLVSNRGFTLVELMVVMTLMGILAAVGMSRFADRDPFAVQGAADQLTSALRVAHATAVARRAPVYVVLGANPATLVLCLDAACAQPLAAPGGEPAWLADASDLRLSTGASFSFDASGAPSFANTLSVLVQTSDGSISSPPVRIEALTGHVHSP